MSETRIVGMPGGNYDTALGARRVKIEVPTDDEAFAPELEDFDGETRIVSIDDSAIVLVDRGAVKVEAANEDSAKTVLVGFPSQRVMEDTPASSLEQVPRAGHIEHEPVVAWLVAVTGPMKGKFFNLKVGQNTIGRDPQSNRVCISGDPGISRNCHLIIIYDPRRVCFVVRPGSEGTGISDLNDELLTTPQPLVHGDLLRLTDDTTLRFIPFCDSSFHW